MKMMCLRDESGSAAVEFAVISVVLIAVLFGIIEFGILLFDKHVLTNASREGARAGVVMRVPRLPDAAIISKVDEYAQAHMISFGASSTLNTTVTPPEASRSGAALFGTEMEVTVTYPYEFMVLSGFGLGPVNLTAKTRMRME